MQKLKEAITRLNNPEAANLMVRLQALIALLEAELERLKAETPDMVKETALSAIQTEVQKAFTEADTKTVMKVVKQILGNDLKGDKGEPGEPTPPTVEQLLALITPLIPAPIKGDKGDAGAPGKPGKNAVGKPGTPGAKGDPGNDGSPDTADEIAAKLNTTTESVEMSVIKGLEKKFGTVMADFERRFSSLKQLKGGGGGDSLLVVDLSDSLDGASKTFTLPAHRKIVSVNSDGAPMGAFRPTVDYTHTRTSITFTANVDAPSALALGHSLVILVTK